MRYRICSFNVKNLSDGDGRDLDRIAKIINDNHADIVCLQEVLQEGKILEGFSVSGVAGQAKAYDRSLLRRLRGHWRSQWKAPKIRLDMEQYLGGDRRGEGFAILWKTDRLDLPKDKYGNDVLPTIYENYKTDPVDSKLRLIRDPLYARFIVHNRPAEIRIISTHLIFGKNDSLKDFIDYGAMEMRRKEFEMIAGQIYYRVSEMYKDINATAPYTIMLGDYNMNLGSSLPITLAFDKKGRIVSDSNAYFTVNNLQNALTTLKSKEP
ncbi:MAG: endonuclease/exonuclease/phosphatase family protein [Pseudobutyrivibrio sp.]|nr:endonuclease/exonuclease/phosphatase family protein [Pseudobutyrivibrio sp.]